MILLGPPGAGKGTHAERFSRRHGLDHISTGDMLREAVRDKKKLGLKAKAFMDRGRLVPDALVIELVRERLLSGNTSKGFVLDGFPRNLKQARDLERMLKGIRREIPWAVYLKVSQATVLARLGGRRVCENCGRIYNIPNMPPRREGVCDKCGSALVQRKDDEAETVHKRLKVYEEETQDLIEYYRGQRLLREVRGDGSLEEVQGELDRVFLEDRKG